MAVVTGTSAKDFIHVAGDGLVAPGGYLDNPTATDSSDTIDISQGGRDIVFAGRGNDIIYAGASLTDGDQIVGGGGDDTLSLDGDYSQKLTFKPTTISAIDALTLAGGHDYNLRMDDGNLNVAIFTVDASDLGLADSLIFDGRREQDSAFHVIGGAGDDVLKAGAEGNLFDLSLGGNDHVVGSTPRDVFDFGTTFNEQDFVDGGAVGSTLNLTSEAGTTTDLILNYDYMRNLHTINLEGSFNITAKNNFLRSGERVQQVFVNGEGYGGSSVLTFDASRERDSDVGYTVTGGLGDDVLTGGRGADVFWGLDGKDTLTPGAGTNIIAYGRNGAAESTSLGYDIIDGFDCNTDLFAFPQFITQVRSTVATGQLSSATFDSDLAAAVQASNLVQGCAVLFTPTSGDLADRTFLVVNGDNQAGYRAGSDYVIEIRNIEHVAQFGTGNFGSS